MFSEATKYFLDMYYRGDMPARELDGYLMEHLPDEGGKAAFNQLPQELQDAVIVLILRYQQGGTLFEYGAEMENSPRDLAPAAERFIKEVLGE